MCHHYKNQSVNSVQGITAANSKNHMKSINTFYGQYADSLNVKASGIYSYHYVLNINWILPKDIRPKIHNNDGHSILGALNIRYFYQFRIAALIYRIITWIKLC